MGPACGAVNLAFRVLGGLSRGGGPDEFDRVIASNGTLFEHPGKDPFAGHDAVTGLVIDCAAVVALLADLGDFHDRLCAEADAGANGKGFPIDSNGRDVLGKVAEADIEPLLARQIDAFGG